MATKPSAKSGRASSTRWYVAILLCAALVNIAWWISIVAHRGPPPVEITLKTKAPKTTRAPQPTVTIAATPLPTGSDVGMRLLNRYNASRPNRACTPLPSNVTIALEDDFEPGFSLEVLMPASRKEELRRQYPPTNKKTNVANWAYVLIVSNHKYVDGALVMGDSLRELSMRVRNGECDLVIIVTDSIVHDSLKQLALVFNKVKVVRSLGRFATKSAYKATFDKAYLFFLLDYERVMFLDADHLVYKGTGVDGLWTKKPLNAPNEIMAVGDTEYFQTALMVVQPNRDVFIDIYLEFRYGTFGYNQWRARDGILLRNCLLPTVQGIGHPPGLFHFYGFTKPWFNKDKKPKRKSEHYMLTYDFHYRDWWRRYEALHELAFKNMTISTPYGQDAWLDANSKAWLKRTNQQVSPANFMWLQRYSKGSEYFRPLTRVKQQINDVMVPELRVVVASNNANCDSTCELAKLYCREDALLFSSINNQSYLFGLSVQENPDDEPVAKKKGKTPPPRGSCEVTDSVGWVPAIGPAGRCVMSANDDPLDRALCNATTTGNLRRVCTCVSEKHRFDDPVPNWNTQPR